MEDVVEEKASHLENLKDNCFHINKYHVTSSTTKFDPTAAVDGGTFGDGIAIDDDAFCSVSKISSKILSMVLPSKIQFEVDLHNSELEILRDFHLQIALQPLQFTTDGYYTINLQLLAGIFTGVASYEGNFLAKVWN